jgi:hypothetical protein
MENRISTTAVAALYPLYYGRVVISNTDSSDRIAFQPENNSFTVHYFLTIGPAAIITIVIYNFDTCASCY